VTTYQDFLGAKVASAPTFGFDVPDSAIHASLKPHQRDSVRWAIAGGRRGLFHAFGLGKTRMGIEVVRLVVAHVVRETIGRGRGLIIAPLGVRREFLREADALTVMLRFVRTTAEAEDPGLYLTNYESVRDGRLDQTAFDVVHLDEASVLRGFGGTKTFREFMSRIAGDDGGTGQGGRGVPYRFVATATPSPNEYIELLSYAAYLGVMQVSEAKTRFFKRDATKADHLTLHPHKRREFWTWVASWGLFVQTPSDLGYSDEGYALPPVTVRWHEVGVDHRTAGEEMDGQGKMFRSSALGLSEAAREKRDSLDARVAKALEIISEREAPGVRESLLRQESGAPAGSTAGAGASELQGEAGRVQAADPEGAVEEVRPDAGPMAGLVSTGRIDAAAARAGEDRAGVRGAAGPR